MLPCDGEVEGVLPVPPIALDSAPPPADPPFAPIGVVDHVPPDPPPADVIDEKTELEPFALRVSVFVPAAPAPTVTV